ncbi:hypothetical protein D8674_030427 [Pyrus ussuriensis x Pyrus communis]|uniref:Uncharacterized protein n=1 Tax=Pyrus ussuriensis x Pyrus communis TaxID=2448454 RepID=A0A5N5EW39_9ROSA|nr:hypothetical protein D8674_030427 [Pyrus ussuriensis x Pyrus communis]
MSTYAVRIDPMDRFRCSSVTALTLDCIPSVKRRVPSSPAFRARAPCISVPSSPTVNPAPAASEPTPQLNQPPIVRQDRIRNGQR